MNLRRKLSPAPIARPDATLPPRRVAASSVCTFALPTVAALLMMGGVACSSTANADGDVAADLPTRHAIASSTSTPSTPSTTTAPSTGGQSLVEPIDPDPHLVKGESAIVMPKGPPKTPPKPPMPPTHVPKHLGGAPMMVDPFP